jgi:hypothetical protein
VNENMVSQVAGPERGSVQSNPAVCVQYLYALPQNCLQIGQMFNHGNSKNQVV